MSNDETTMRRRLRSATAELHKQLEDRLAFQSGKTDKAYYLAFLTRMHGLLLPIENALARLDWTQAGIDFCQRRRHPLIEADLRDLGLTREMIARLPASDQLPPLGTISSGLGVLYVLEGSALGGQVILQQLGDSLGISPSHGGRFLAGHGERSGQMWRYFIHVLDAHGATDPEAEAVVDAAMSTFRIFDSWFAREPLSSLATKFSHIDCSAITSVDFYFHG